MLIGIREKLKRYLGLLNNNGSYQISRYYHTNPTSLIDLKYEGFVAG